MNNIIKIPSQNSEESLRLELKNIEELAHIGRWSLNLISYEFNFSDEIYNILKINHEGDNISYNTFISLIFPSDKDLVVHAIRKLIDYSIPMELDFRIILPDGEIRTIQMRGKTSSTFNKSENHIFGTIQDRTEYVSIKSKYDKIKNKYDQLFNNGLYGIYTSTVGGKIISANPKFYKILVVPLAYENIPLNIYKQGYVKVDRKEELLTLFCDKDEIYGFESEWKKDDGKVITIRENIRAIKSVNGDVIQYEGTVEDITEQIISKKQLEIARAKAENSDMLKSAFLSQISHEIRTPINSLLNYAELISYSVDINLNEDLKMSLSGINRTSNRLIRTMDLIINMSEMMNGSYKISPKKIDLFSDVLKKAFSNHVVAAKNKGIKLSLVNNADDPTIKFDEYSIIQIFDNLIDNAIKYTDKGTVEISIDKEVSDNLSVSVRDSGIGIAKEFLPHIFDPFSQEESGYTRSYEGNGLGLALVKKFCELQNAIVNVETEKGSGTIFKITFLNR